MPKHPLVVGVRQFETPHPGNRVQVAIDGLGRNTGNMMFTHSLCQVLADARWGSFNFKPEDLHDRDAIVLASANWINGFEDFGWLADRLEKTTLPVFLIGVGAQASLSMEIPKVSPGTLRLLALVRDRSISIAARGSFTCEVLEQLGIKSAVETGCPSLLLAGAEGPKINLNSISRETCVVHSTRHGFQGADAFQQWLYNQALKGNYDILLQSELSDIYLTLESADEDLITDSGFKAIAGAYGMSEIHTIQSYLRSHGKVFLNYPDWIAFMKTRTLCFGTRIHGTVASLLAGTPAMLVCHDSRTLEMARSMSIPMVLSTSLDTGSDLSLENIPITDQISEFLVGYQKYFSNYCAYFATNQFSLA